MNKIEPISVVVGILLSILANLLTAPIQGSLSTHFSTPRRLKTLQQELTQVTEFHNNINHFYLKTISTLFIVLVCMGVGDATWALAEPIGLSVWFVYPNLPGATYEIMRTILNLAGVLSYMVGVSIAVSYLRLLSKLTNFDRYKALVDAKVNRLTNSQNIT